MRVIVAGSRSVTDYAVVRQAIIDSGFSMTKLVSGGARGVDRLGERFAQERGIEVLRFDAQWTTRKRAAGPIRNERMGRAAEALVAIWDGLSPGTLHMIDVAKRRRLRLFVRNLMTGQDERR